MTTIEEAAKKPGGVGIKLQPNIAMVPVDGTLRFAIFTDVEQRYIQGRIYRDSKGRFEDGKLIKTSEIIRFLAFNCVVTKNSVYGIEWLDEDKIKKDWKHG